MAAKKRDRRETVPLRIGGMYTAGDAALIPAGYTRLQRNTAPLAGGTWPVRPPMVFDLAQTDGTAGFAEWEDRANGVRRLLALGLSTDGHIKSASAETWSSFSGWNSLNQAAHVSYRGRTYITTLQSDSVTSSYMSVFDTTNGNNPVFLANEGYRPLGITSFIDRLFFGGGLISISNIIPNPLTNAYDLTAWTAVNFTARNVTSSGTTTCLITPGDVTTNTLTSPASGSFTSASSGGKLIYRGELAADSPSYAVPVTLRLLINNPWTVATAYGANAIVNPTTRNDFRYRVKTAGTSSATTEPTWPTTVGAEVVDNGVTWVCDGPDVIGSVETTVQPSSEMSAFVPFEVVGTLQVPHGATKVSAQIKSGNTATASVLTTASVRVSYRDGLADSNPAKANHGHQITYTEAHLPFMNYESVVTLFDNGDTVYWSEPGEPSNVLGTSYYRLRDRAGKITAVKAIAGRLVVFKRNMIDTFVPDALDPDNPITRERTYVSDGVLGPRAVDACDGVFYGIGQNSVWRWNPGGEVEDICDDGMRDEIMDKSVSTWVEYQSTCKIPILTVDQARKIVYVYTQKGKIYGYRIQSKEWFRYDVNSAGFDVRDMLWHQTSGKLYIAWDGQSVSRLDHSVSNQGDAVNNSGTTYPVVSQTDIPIEFRGPQLDVILDRVNAYIKATADQTGQVFYVYVSTDQGATFTLYNEITLPVSNAFTRVPIDLYQMQPSFIVRLQKEGNGGAANYMLSSAEAEINIMSGAWQRNSPTQLGSSLA